MAKEEPKEQEENHLEQLQRLQAEFENYQKRVEKEQVERVKYASTNLLKKLLNGIDAFEQALRAMQTEDEHTEGIKMIYEGFMKILEGEEVRAMETLGKQLNPEEHEVLAKVPSSQEEGMVVEEVQKGYFYKDKILRHAKVNISSGKA